VSVPSIDSSSDVSPSDGGFAAERPAAAQTGDIDRLLYEAPVQAPSSNHRQRDADSRRRRLNKDQFLLV